jgi:hypothetical protein
MGVLLQTGAAALLEGSAAFIARMYAWRSNNHAGIYMHAVQLMRHVRSPTLIRGTWHSCSNLGAYVLAGDPALDLRRPSGQARIHGALSSHTSLTTCGACLACLGRTYTRLLPAGLTGDNP